jgi:8-hydroxy-5-deazaflavin:NADPH oxidoreductase
MKIGIIGAGMIGGTLARRWADAGHDIVIANSRGPATLAPLIAEIGARAEAATAAEAAAAADVVLVAVPFKAVRALPAAQLAGKVVIDATNYYPARDGHIDDLDQGAAGSSEITARQLPGARVVKAFNTIYFVRLRDEGRPRGAPDRQVVFVAGDDDGAKATVAALIDEIGFDTIDTGSLAGGGRRQQPGTPIYNRPLTREEAEEILNSA